MGENQRRMVLKHLQEHGSITSMQAFELYGITRLSSIIHHFRKMNINVHTLMIDGKTRYGNSCKYAKYILGTEGEE